MPPANWSFAVNAASLGLEDSSQGRPLPRRLVRWMERYFDADFSAVQVHVGSQPTVLGASAFTHGDQLYFARGSFQPESRAGLRLVAHELTHVLQQRAGLTTRMGSRLGFAYDPLLEAQADAMADMAVLRFAATCHPPRHDIGPNTLPIKLTTASDRVFPEHEVIQPFLNVNGSLVAELPVSVKTLPAGEQEFCEYMIKHNRRTFWFLNELALVNCLKRCSKLYQSSKGKLDSIFSDSRYDVLCEKVTLAALDGGVEKGHSEWLVRIKLTTEKGNTITIPVFSSVKRHMILSFMHNQYNPRNIPDQNSIVRDPDIFANGLQEFAQCHAQAIKGNLMAFMYEPCKTKHTNPAITFESEDPEIPHFSYLPKNPNGIHCYPARGSEVKQLNRIQYQALTKFLLWFFKTEEFTSEGEIYDRVKAETNPQKLDKKLKEVDGLKASITEGLKYLKQHYKLPAPPCAAIPGLAKQLDLTYQEERSKGVKHYNVYINSAIKELYQLLIEFGEKPAVDKKVVQSKPSSSILFKTHKCEVRSAIANLPHEIAAWLVEGYVDVLESKDSKGVTKRQKIIKLYDPSANFKKRESVATQVQGAKKETLQVLTPASLEKRIENLFDLYMLALKSPGCSSPPQGSTQTIIVL